MHRLAGKRAVVTGGAQGIGRGIATGFAREGADVAVIDVQPDEAGKQFIAYAEAAGRRGFYVRADVASEAEVMAAMTAAARALGGVDILVNNAGVVAECPVAEMPVAEWDRIIAVNLRGPFLCTRAVLPTMIAQGQGRIINMASQLGQLGGETMAHYSASKAGVIGFTKAHGSRGLAPQHRCQRDRSRPHPDRDAGQRVTGMGAAQAQPVADPPLRPGG